MQLLARWIVAAILTAGCGSPQGDTVATAVDDGAAARAAIDSTNGAAAAARVRLDAAAYVRAYADDATVMQTDGSDVVGKQAIEEMVRTGWSRFPPTDTLLFAEWRADTVDVHGNYAYEVGRGLFVRRSKQDASSPPDTSRTRYFTFWRRDADGVWRATRDFGVRVANP